MYNISGLFTFNNETKSTKLVNKYTLNPLNVNKNINNNLQSDLNDSGALIRNISEIFNWLTQHELVVQEKLVNKSREFSIIHLLKEKQENKREEEKKKTIQLKGAPPHEAPIKNKQTRAFAQI